MATSLREDILEAAVLHIAEHGPDSLSFRKLASDAGVSHQAPYHHFGDRRGVFRAIALDGFVLLGSALSAAATRAEELLEAYVGFASDHPGHFRVMFRRDLCEMEDAPELQRVADGTFDALVDHVRSELGGKASITEIRARATAMWSLAHGLATLIDVGLLEARLGSVVHRRAFVKSVARASASRRAR